MGNIHNIMEANTSKSSDKNSEDFANFHGEFAVDDRNGLCFNNSYIPEEVLINILNKVNPNELLNLTLVCRRWCNIIKSDIFWMELYVNKTGKKLKRFPWYVYYFYFTSDYFENLIKNGNGKQKLKYWTVLANGGNGFRIEPKPVGSDDLPNVPELMDRSGRRRDTCCFVTSYASCIKSQIICIKNKCFQYILNECKLPIYVSEWTAARFDCGAKYKMIVELKGDNETLRKQKSVDLIDSLDRVKWRKVEMIIDEYPQNLKSINFTHQGKDTQFWAGHYGSKMAGTVVKFLLDTEDY